MTTPLLSRITTEITTRLAVINKVNGYYSDMGTTVRHGKVVFDDDAPPCTAVLLAPRSPGDSDPSGSRTKVALNLIIEGHHKIVDGEEPGDAAIKMLADIQRAVEIEPHDFDGLLLTPGLQWVGDDITYPEEAGSVVSVNVAYSIPHMRFIGDPNKPPL